MTGQLIRYEELNRTNGQLWDLARVIAELRLELRLLDQSIADLQQMAQRIDLVLATPAASRRNTRPVGPRNKKTLILVTSNRIP